MPIDAVLPAFLIAALGYVTGKKLNLDNKTLARLCLYILTPALTFNSLATSNVDLTSAWKLVVSTFVSPFVVIPLFLGIFRILKYDKATSRALLLPSAFMNSGNYGLPVCLFAFGQDGMDFAAVFMVTESIIIATLGVYIAASSKMDGRAAIKQVFKMPTVYAAIAGLLVRTFSISIPEIIMRPVEMLSSGAIGIFLFLLGLQLVETVTSSSFWKPISTTVFLRLMVAPIVAGTLGTLIRLEGLAWKILILQAAMPPAVNSTILAQEFDAKPQMVSGATLTGTIISTITLTLWIAILRAM